VKDHEEMLKRPPDQALKYSLPYQMSHMARERGCLEHDDKIDALTMAVSYWTEAMARDAKEAISERKEALLEEELRKIEDAVGGIVRKKGEDPELDGRWFSV
jgi:hypothetical protein